MEHNVYLHSCSLHYKYTLMELCPKHVKHSLIIYGSLGFVRLMLDEGMCLLLISRLWMTMTLLLGQYS